VSAKTKMWVLAVLVTALAAAVIWQIVHGKNELLPKPADVASARVPTSAVGKPAAGVPTSPPPVVSRPLNIPPSAIPPQSSRRSDEIASSRRPSSTLPETGGSEGDANSLRDNGKTGGEVPDSSAHGGGGGGLEGPTPDGQSMNNRGPSVDEMVQNAQTALARGNLISPRDGSALYWVRRVQQVDPQNRVAIQIEDMILVGSIRVIEADRRAGRYDGALRNLDMLQSLYPNRRDDLGQLRSSIVNDQRRSALAPR
jgi:hypothetical protein